MRTVRTIELLQGYKLATGYAYQSSQRRPKEPQTVVVGSEEAAICRCVGSAYIDGCNCLCFKVTGKRRYYFQCQPY